MTAVMNEDTALPDELAEVLHTGPFARALDEAIRFRGLSLEAAQRRMAALGAEVSQASLSYWRHGHRRPEGERSIRAVHALEESLGLSRGVLVRLIGPPRPRGRWISSPPSAIDLATALEVPPAALDSCDGIDLDGNTRVAIAWVRERVLISADRTERLVTTEMVVISKVDGVDRWVCFFHPQDGGEHRPTLVHTDCCRPGRIRSDPDTELFAVELRFNHPLRAGESYVFEFAIGYAGPPPRTDYVQYGLRTPARQLVVQVAFDPATPPVRCYRYYRPRVEPLLEESELPVGAGTSSHIAVLDAQPGVHGIRWEWD